MPRRGAGRRLIERERELGELEAWAGALSDGESGVMTVEGLPGTGKSALLGECLGAAPDLTRLPVVAHPLERDLPFGVIDASIGRHLRELPQRRRQELLSGAEAIAGAAFGLESPTPEQGELDPGPSIRLAICSVLERLAEGGPLLIAVDDLQWADEASIIALIRAIRAGCPIGLLLGTRPVETSDVRTELTALGGKIELDALSQSGTRQLLDLLGVGRQDGLDESYHRATAGNPQLLTMLASSVRDGEVQIGASGGPDFAEFVPDSVVELTTRRLSRSSGATVAAAEALAVLGEATLGQLTEICELDGPSAVEAIEELEMLGICAEGSPIRLAHPIVSEALYGSLSAARLEHLHLEAARLLENVDLPLAASHLLRLPPQSDGWQSQLLSNAGHEAARRGTPALALELADSALQRWKGRPPLHLELDRCRFALAAGDGRASAMLEAVLPRTADTEQRLGTMLMLAQAEYLRGGSSEGARVLREALEALEDAEGDRLASEVIYAYTAFERRRGGDLAGARSLTRDRIAIAERAGRDPDPAIVVSHAFDHVLDSRPADEIADSLHRSVERLRAPKASQGPALFPAWAPLHEGIWLIATMGELNLAREMADEAVARARRAGSDLMIGPAHHLRLWVAWHQGDLRTCIDDSARAFELADRGWSRFAAGATWIGARVRRLQGDDDGAAEIVVRGRQLTGGSARAQERMFVERSRSEQAEWAGDHRGALAAAIDAAEAAASIGVDFPFIYPARTTVARLQTRLGLETDFAGAFEHDLHLARRSGIPLAIGSVLLEGCAMFSGDRRLELASEAHRHLAGGEALIRSLEAQIELGSALRATRRDAEAREHLRDAVHAADRLGASALAGRAREELRIAGGRPMRSERFGDLTEGELRVAQMAAAGRSNPEIASELTVARRTVETHLTAVYRKLGIRGRAELNRALGEL